MIGITFGKVYHELRNSLAQDAKRARFGEKPAHGRPSERDFWVADCLINEMAPSTLMLALANYEEEMLRGSLPGRDPLLGMR